MNDDSFAHARANARPDCPKCHGAGAIAYDDNHAMICPACCKHDRGWWLLEKYYGEHNGKLCCLAGCGKTKAPT